MAFLYGCAGRLTTKNGGFRRGQWLDHNLGTVLDSLEAEGLKESTLVLLHGDHGALPVEHADTRAV